MTFTVSYAVRRKAKKRGPGPGNGGSSGGNARDRRRWRRRLDRAMGPPPPSLFAQTAAKLRDDLHALMERQVWEGDTSSPNRQRGPTRGDALVSRMAGSLGPGPSTDEVMAMTRGED